MGNVFPKLVCFELRPCSNLTDNLIAWTPFSLGIGVVAEDRLLNRMADAVKLLLWRFIHPMRKFSVLSDLNTEAKSTAAQPSRPKSCVALSIHRRNRRCVTLGSRLIFLPISFQVQPSRTI